MMRTRQEIDRYTAEKLLETLEYAVGNSVFYREKYGSLIHGLSRDGRSLQSLQAFASLPFTTQDELRERGMEFLCVSQREISRIVTLDTGGTTGAPKRIYFTEEDQQLTVDYFCSGMQIMADSSDKVLVLMPAKAPGSVGRLLARGLRGFGARAVEYGLPDLMPTKGMEDPKNRRRAEELLALMAEEGVTSVVALPTHMRMLAECAAEMSSAPRLKFVLLSAEYVADEVVRRVEEVFGCKVYEHYGMTEMGLGCAVSCGRGRGYHIREADLYLEIVDPDTGRAAAPGEYGEIVFTTLTRKGMPFIRYRTGDISRWLTEPCPCGSIWKRLDRVGSRGCIKGYLR